VWYRFSRRTRRPWVPRQAWRGGGIPFDLGKSVVSSSGGVTSRPKTVCCNLISADRFCWQQILRLFTPKSGRYRYRHKLRLFAAAETDDNLPARGELGTYNVKQRSRCATTSLLDIPSRSTRSFVHTDWNEPRKDWQRLKTRCMQNYSQVADVDCQSEFTVNVKIPRICSLTFASV